MENWLPAIVSIIPSLVAIVALWWKITSDLSKMASKMATKDDLNNAITNAITGINKRIDDLREQMTREYSHLAQKVDETSVRLDKIETQMDRNEQNHLEHITQLHTK